MASQQKKVRRPEKTHVWSTTGIYFLNPFLTIVFLYVGSLDNFAKACFFREETVTARWEEAVR